MRRLILKDGNGDFWEVVEKRSETQFLVVKLNPRTYTRDMRRKCKGYKSGLMEGYVDLECPTMSHFKIWQEGTLIKR